MGDASNARHDFHPEASSPNVVARSESGAHSLGEKRPPSPSSFTPDPPGKDSSADQETPFHAQLNSLRRPPRELVRHATSGSAHQTSAHHMDMSSFTHALPDTGIPRSGTHAAFSEPSFIHGQHFGHNLHLQHQEPPEMSFHRMFQAPQTVASLPHHLHQPQPTPYGYPAYPPPFTPMTSDVRQERGFNFMPAPTHMQSHAAPYSYPSSSDPRPFYPGTASGYTIPPGHATGFHGNTIL